MRNLHRSALASAVALATTLGTTTLSAQSLSEDQRNNPWFTSGAESIYEAFVCIVSLSIVINTWADLAYMLVNPVMWSSHVR